MVTLLAIIGAVFVCWIGYLLVRVAFFGASGMASCRSLGLNGDQAAAAAAMVSAYGGRVKRAPALHEQQALIVIAATLPDGLVVAGKADGPFLLETFAEQEYVENLAKELRSGMTPAQLLSAMTAHRREPFTP